MTNTKNTPVEALERSYPMRVLRYRLRRGSGGAGRCPGGEGIERDLQMLEDVTVSLITERRVSQPWGLAGGEPGAPGENWLLPQGDESRATPLADKCTVRLRAGDVLRMLTPGGGGWVGRRPRGRRGHSGAGQTVVVSSVSERSRTSAILEVETMAVVTVFAVVRPWSYWLAPPLLAAAVVLALALAVGYYREVLAPWYEWAIHDRQQRLSEIRRTSIGRASRRRARGDARPLAA